MQLVKIVGFEILIKKLDILHIDIILLQQTTEDLTNLFENVKKILSGTQ